MKIDSYSFGRIVIDGKSYSSDVIILKDRVISNWWRREGHTLCLDDLKSIPFISSPLRGEDLGEGEKIEVLIIGTGASGMMKVLKEVMDYFTSKGIKLIEERTEEACRIYNKLSNSHNISAALHLTC